MLRWVFLWFLRVIVGFPIIYIKVPFDVVQDAFAKLKLIPEEWTKYDTKWQWFKPFKFDSDANKSSHNSLMKLFEQLCEALPQLSLAVSYYTENSEYIWATEMEVKIGLSKVVPALFSRTKEDGLLYIGPQLGTVEMQRKHSLKVRQHLISRQVTG